MMTMTNISGLPYSVFDRMEALLHMKTDLFRGKK